MKKRTGKYGKHCKSQDLEFYEDQEFLRKNENERFDVYSKPGTSKRDPNDIGSIPTSRYRSRRP